MRFTPQREAALLSPYRQILFSTCEDFSCGPLAGATNSAASSAWTSANDPVALPFVVRTPAIVTHLGWLNGSAAGGGVDMGVYDLSWNRLVSTGSQTGTGNSIWQFIDVTDTPLPVGRYYAVMARDNTSVNTQFMCATTASAPFMAFVGTQDSATNAFPLPNPLTNMAAAATFTRFPFIGVAFRAPYV